MYGVERSEVTFSGFGVLVGSTVGSAVGRAILELMGRVGDGTVSLVIVKLSPEGFSHAVCVCVSIVDTWKSEETHLVRIDLKFALQHCACDVVDVVGSTHLTDGSKQTPTSVWILRTTDGVCRRVDHRPQVRQILNGRRSQGSRR